MAVSNQPGRIKRSGRVSESLQESPRLLARPSPPKSWDVSRRAGCPAGGGIGGEGGHPRPAQKTLKSLAATVPSEMMAIGDGDGFVRINRVVRRELVTDENKENL
jgi:hypothetical protein